MARPRATESAGRIAWLLRAVLLAQLAGIVVLELGYRRLLGVEPSWAWLLAAISVLLIHPLVVAIDFAITRYYASPAPSGARVSPLEALTLFVREYWASVRGFSIAHPFLGHLPPPPPQGAPPHPPLLFVHGYFCNRALWRPFARSAAKAGFQCAAVTLLPAVSVEQSIDLIVAEIEALCRATGHGQVTVIAHSMGGLAVRAYLKRHGDARLLHLYALGTPHAGTVLAGFGRSEQVRQMRIHSPWLQALSEGEPSERRQRITSVFSYHDNIVAPQLSAALPGSRWWPLTGLGHVSLAYEPNLRAAILEEARGRVSYAAIESETPRGTASSSFCV